MGPVERWLGVSVPGRDDYYHSARGKVALATDGVVFSKPGAEGPGNIDVIHYETIFD